MDAVERGDCTPVVDTIAIPPSPIHCIETIISEAIEKSLGMERVV